jgi:alkanesulfonate monooxygenase SsuD/methylene tetrahydromethanopterin reductase-like flavin-dependent oxidoreductase (luciferase family)
MDIGIGLPSTIPGADRDQNLAWARRADERGFSTLGVIDRIVYTNLEPLIALAAAAGVTERIRLTSSIVIGPYRNTALLAKQAASLDVLSGGRLTVGIAPGGRPDDFEAAGVDFRARGRLFDDQLAELKRIWSGDEIGPAAEREGGPELIVGGYVDAAFRRTARYGDGWIAGGRPPDDVARGGEAVRQAWEAAGRAGKPRLLGLAYFALGPEAEAAADGYLKHYYAWLGDMAGAIAASAATDPETVKQYADAYAAAGLDELILFPCSPEPDQVDLLADVVL